MCLSASKKGRILKLIEGHFCDKVIELVKDHKTLRGTGDNWDLKILATNTRKDHQNQDLQIFWSNLIMNRVNFNHLLPNESPLCDLKNLKASTFSLNIYEWKQYVESSKIIIARILVEFFPQFGFLKSCLLSHIRQRFSDEMKTNHSLHLYQ